MIYSDANASDGGLSIYITGNGTYTFPLGTRNITDRYTYAEVTVTNWNDDGYITINPVDGELKTTDLTAGDLLDYYWRVGFQDFTTNPTVEYEFKYDDSDIVGTESNYVAGKVLDGNGYIRSDEGNPPDNVDDANNIITFDDEGNGGFTLENANYTAGEPNRFIGTPDEFNSNSSYTTWNTASAWLENLVPTEGSIVYIHNGDRMSGPSTDVGYVAPAETILNGTDARVQYWSSGTFDLGVVKGYGIISFRFPEDATVNGDFADFASDSRSLYLYFATNTATYTLDHIPQPAPSISLETANWIIDQDDLEFNYNFSCGHNHSDVTINKSMLVEGNLNVGDYDRGSFRFPGSGSPVTVTVKGNVNVGDPIVVDDPGSASTLEHKFIVDGNITVTEDNIDLFNASDRPTVILELDGETNNTYTNSAGTIADLYRVVLNKGTSQTNTFTFSDDFNLNGATSGSGILKALELQNGTLILDDAAIDIDLTTSDDDFEIPETACLEVKQGIVNVSGDDSGIYLDGKLLVSGGTVNMDDAANNGNNYIEYSGSGNAELIISGGALTVGSQIRRGLTSSTGILNYAQSGGTVIIGKNAAPEGNRAVFEIVNTGSSFTHSAGNLRIANAQTNATIASLYLNPENSNLSTGTTITLGDANTLANQEFGIYSTINLQNLTLDNTSTNNPIAKMWTIPLSLNGTLTIGSATEFKANALDLNCYGDFTNLGTFTANENTTYFLSGTDQQIDGNTTFYNFINQNTANLNLAAGNTNIIVDNILNLESGTLNDNANEIWVYGDINNDAIHVYGGTGSEDGISLLGTTQQEMTGNGTYGKLTINNGNGITLPVGNAQTITNYLKLEKGVFNIASNLLTLGINCMIQEANPFGENNMIQTNVSFTDNGVKKFFPAGAGSFTYPVGSGGKYTPAVITVTQNTSAVGYLIVKPANEMHTSIIDDSEGTDPDIVDMDNVLQYYWTLIADGFTDGSGTVEFYYDEGDVKVESSDYTVSDYITAKLLSDGAGNWNKFDDVSKFDETNHKLIFDFTDAADVDMTGDYTAGVDGSTFLGAIPDEVPLYVSKGVLGTPFTNLDWNTAETWRVDDGTSSWVTPASQGLPDIPKGARVRIYAGDRVTTSANYINAYTSEIIGTLDVGTTFANRIGNVTGTGTLYSEQGTLPAGYYNEFFSASGGTLEFGGFTDYSVLSNITHVNNLTFSGTSNRELPNLDLTILGNLLFSDVSGSAPNVINEFDQKIRVNGDINFSAGSFDAGTGGNAIVEIGGNVLQTITGNFITTNGSSEFNHLEMSNSSGLVLAGDIEISNKLMFNAGVITSTTTNTITLLNTATDVVDGAGVGKFVDGPLYKYVNSGSSFAFPVGDNNRYGELNITSTVTGTSPDIWEVEYYDHNPNDDGFDPTVFNSPLQVVSNNEYWRIKAPATATAKVGVRWDANSGMTTDATNIGSMRITEWRDLGTIGVTTDDKWEEVDASNTISGTQSAGTVTQTNTTTFNEFTNGNYFTLSTTYTPTTLTWDGSESVVWNLQGNWNNNLVPTAVDDIIIPNVANDPVIDIDAVCAAMNLNNSATLTVNAGKSITLSGSLTMDGDITLKSDATGTGALIDNGSISGSGTATVERFLTGGNFHYVSSPLASVANTTFYRTMPGETNVNPNYYLYDESTSETDWAYGWQAVTSGNMDVGRGYAFYYTKDWTFNLQGGAFNTGDKNFSVVYSNNGVDANGWNLVGNPYPSAISADEFISENSSVINGTLYFWDDDGSDGSGYQSDDYATWNLAGSTGTAGGGGNAPNGRIAIGQSFFVKKSSVGTQNITFTNSMREAGSSVFFKHYRIDSPQRLRLSVLSADGSLYNEALIVFLNGASDGFDNLYDGKKLIGNNNIALYSIMGNENYAIQSFAPVDWSFIGTGGEEGMSATRPKIIPIGLNVSAGGNYSINVQDIENFESDVNIYLYDKQENVYTRLNDIETYSFNISSGFTNDRFEIRFEPNHAPVIETNIANEIVNEDEAFNFTISESAFVEHDKGDHIVSYTAGLADGSSLPSWLSFDETSRIFSGTATNDKVGTISVKLSVKDVLGAITSQTFTLEVLNTNDAPELINTIPDQEVNEGLVYSYAIPENTFKDIDLGDELLLSVKLSDGSDLPTWLAFDNESGQFYGTAEKTKDLNIKLTATDKAGASVSDVFTLSVKSSTTGVSSLSESEIIMYPNPTHGVFYIQMDYYTEDMIINIRDFSGRIIKIVQAQDKKTEINISEFASGMYFIELTDKLESKVFKINLNK